MIIFYLISNEAKSINDQCTLHAKPQKKIQRKSFKLNLMVAKIKIKLQLNKDDFFE